MRRVNIAHTLSMHYCRLTADTVWAILLVTMITANRLRQNAATVSLLSTSLIFDCALRTPMSNSLLSICGSLRQIQRRALFKRHREDAPDLPSVRGMDPEQATERCGVQVNVTTRRACCICVYVMSVLIHCTGASAHRGEKG